MPTTYNLCCTCCSAEFGAGRSGAVALDPDQSSDMAHPSQHLGSNGRSQLPDDPQDEGYYQENTTIL